MGMLTGFNIRQISMIRRYLTNKSVCKNSPVVTTTWDGCLTKHLTMFGHE